MGHDLTLNALPAEHGLLAAMRNGEIDPDLLQWVESYFFYRRRGSRQNLDRYPRFVNAMEALVALNPGIDHRYCNLDRRFEWLNWMLRQCAKNDEEKQIATACIYGATRIFAPAESSQGYPFGWNSPDSVALIHIWLSDLNSTNLRREFDPEKLDRARPYKWRAGEKDHSEEFADIANDFAKLKRFYEAVYFRREGVLSKRD
jgi:hypothetical protein